MSTDLTDSQSRGLERKENTAIGTPDANKYIMSGNTHIVNGGNADGVWINEGTSVSAPDTPELKAAYALLKKTSRTLLNLTYEAGITLGPKIRILDTHKELKSFLIKAGESI